MLRRPSVESLEAIALSVDPAGRDGWSAAAGWTLDRYRVALPSEPPGAPVPDGPFERAAEAIREYRFADPRMVRASWQRDRPLEGRTMLLEVRYLGLRLHMGTRVYRVHDATVELEGRPHRVWGWGYATLTGHLEMGTMDVIATKDLERGDVAVEIDARSRRAPLANPILRAGFRLVGRRAQRRFARRALERLQAIVEDDVPR